MLTRRTTLDWVPTTSILSFGMTRINSQIRRLRRAIVRGNWHHVVGTYDATSGNGLVYLDGVPRNTFCAWRQSPKRGSDDGNWYIGTTRNAASGFNWDGMIDEVAIYPYAMSQQQINEHIRLAARANSRTLANAGFRSDVGGGRSKTHLDLARYIELNSGDYGDLFTHK